MYTALRATSQTLIAFLRREMRSDPVLATMVIGEAADLEQISGRSGLSVAQLLPRLLELELAGGLRREPGGRFVRVDRTC